MPVTLHYTELTIVNESILLTERKQVRKRLYAVLPWIMSQAFTALYPPHQGYLSGSKARKSPAKIRLVKWLITTRCNTSILRRSFLSV
jgi:hypothetical protein